MKIPASSPVMVTGSTGYVGGVLVKQLLEAGLTVHCPVRDSTNESKIKHLKNLSGSERLKFFEADLLGKGSYLEAMTDCSVVFHVASPLILSVPKTKIQEVLLDPAVKGTLNILESANDPVSCVKRVVVTSCIAAIATDGTDCEAARKKTGKMCNEEIWNTTASVDYQPYSYSKAMAEKAAWNYVKENNCGYDLVVCNPSFIMGPGIKIHESSESYSFVKKLGDGKLASGCPDLSFAVVDVRDVARGHIAAGFLPSEMVAGQRFILNASNTFLIKMADAIRETYPDHPLPASNVPKWLFWAVAPYFGAERIYVTRSVGHRIEMDNSKSLNCLELGEYKTLPKTMGDMFRQCIENGYIPEA